ncbi:MAG: DUF929 family protein [Acidimicrobiales bacterium]
MATKKPSNATKRPSNQRPNPGRAPARGGRPAGLFTWLAVGLVVVVVAALVIIKVASGGSTPPGGSSSWQAASPTTVTQLTTVPASVFNTVGVTSPIAPVTPPQAVKNQPALTGTEPSGQVVPEVLYMGAEYCPYCAAQRWATIIALSRFGTWSGLGNISSYSGDVYPNTPSFTFVKAKYTSKYLVFKSVETYTNYLDAAKTYYAVLQKPSTAQEAEIKKYDTPKYITGLTASTAGSIPFISFDNKYFVVGASYSPTTLAGSSRTEIAAALDNATSPVTQAIISSANYQTAVICTLTKQQPSNVCASAGVTTAVKAMGIK